MLLEAFLDYFRRPHLSGPPSRLYLVADSLRKRSNSRGFIELQGELFSFLFL